MVLTALAAILAMTPLPRSVFVGPVAMVIMPRRGDEAATGSEPGEPSLPALAAE